MPDLNRKVIWLIALPNGGKSAIAKILTEKLTEQFPCTILLDGDDLRVALQMTQSNYDLKSRTENGYRIGRLAQMFSNQGACVVVAANTLFHEVQQWNRENLNYFEVYIETDEATRRARDSKKRLYAKYDAGELKDILGIDIPPDIPQHPDLIIKSTIDSSVSSHVEAILTALESPL